MQTNGTYIEQFAKLEKVVYKELETPETKEINLDVANVTEWYLDDKIDGLKHTTTSYRLDFDNKLMFLSEPKALLLATSIIKNIAKNSDADVKEVIRKLALEVEE